MNTSLYNVPPTKAITALASRILASLGINTISIIKRVFFIGFITVFSSINTLATSLNPLTLKQLYTHSDLIVVAQVTSVKSFTKSKTIYSSYLFDVEQYLKGSGASSLSLTQIGGKTKQYHTLISGLRQYKKQERVVLFLNSNENGDLDTLGYAQGSILLKNETLTFDHYHFFVDSFSIEQFNISSREYKLHKQLNAVKHLSYLKELIKLYAS